MNDIKIEIKELKLSQIKLNPNNPRIIKDNKYKQLVKSLQDFPEMKQIREIVIDENNMILGGNMRFKALQELKEKSVICKIVSGLTDEQKQEFIIKDNVGFGEWDYDVLANEWDSDLIIEWGLDLPVWTTEDMAEADNSNKEIDTDDLTKNLNCICPKCGFEFEK